jgi:glycosyltransferase involved in cell wall biosynthesis
MDVAIVHDYLTQRGGAERVVLTLTRAFPEAPVYTSLYDPPATFPAFTEVDVRTLPINRLTTLRRHHRAALPFLAPSFSQLRVSADVVICSSSGWAHGARVDGKKIVYCHAPARWLYQRERYLRGRSRATRSVASLLQARLERWDRAAAASADAYLANSTVVAERVKSAYGIDPVVVPPPPTIVPDGLSKPVAGVNPGFALCVARLLPYKNVDAIVGAFASLPELRLVIVGSGPEEGSLKTHATPNVRFVGTVDDATLRWLYANCRFLVAAAHEDFGLTPLEAAGFGKPTVALRAGGYLDTVLEERNGIFFESAEPDQIAAAVRAAVAHPWSAGAIESSADRFSETTFIDRLRETAALVSR